MESLDLMLNCIVIVLSVTICRSSNVLPPYEEASKIFHEYPLPELQYGLHDLEPFIDVETVRAHYNGHHEAYRKKMNAFLQQWRSDSNDSKPGQQDLFDILKNLDQVPLNLKDGIKNNMGGYVNHALYWSILSPNLNKVIRKPVKDLLLAIERSFGSFEQFKDIFTSKALSLFGSGYVWLVSEDAKSLNSQLLVLMSTNQDCPLSDDLYPILVIDVWEHAYYLKHQFRRNDHISDYWFLVDWDKVDKLWQYWNKRVELSLDEKEEL